MPNPGVGLIHPGLGRALDSIGAYPQRVTITAGTSATDSAGMSSPTGSATIEDYADIPARMAPGSGGSGAMAREEELRREDGSVVTDIWRIGLCRYCPAVTTAHQAVVDGAAYDILTVEADAQSSFTWLTVEKVA